MQLGPQKDLLLPGEPDPCPHPSSHVPYQPSFALCKGRPRVTEDWGCGGRSVFQRLSGLVFGLHLPICEMGEEERRRAQVRKKTGDKRELGKFQTGDSDQDRRTQAKGQQQDTGTGRWSDKAARYRADRN